MLMLGLGLSPSPGVGGVWGEERRNKGLGGEELKAQEVLVVLTVNGSFFIIQNT
jgi:hypothetical protein